jgi:outer membrane protein
VLRRGLLLWLALAACAGELRPQCAGEVTTPGRATDCTARSTPQSGVASVDPSHLYSLAELIDIAEHNNPRTRIAWERAKQKADQLGIERSAY